MTKVLRENVYILDNTTTTVTTVKDQDNTYFVNKIVESEHCGSNEHMVKIHFQDGPIKENDVNGCQNEDLIAIIIDRLEGFQNTEFKCRENAIAITKLEEALMWLEKRTANRIARGVEGTNKV